eukprot:608367-Pyramimonas_sp.AAC.1
MAVEDVGNDGVGGGDGGGHRSGVGRYTAQRDWVTRGEGSPNHLWLTTVTADVVALRCYCSSSSSCLSPLPCSSESSAPPPP